MITSAENPKIKRIVRLNEKARARREEGVFAAEGRKLFQETPAELLEEVYVSSSFLTEEKNRHLLAEKAVVPEEVDDRVFLKMCDTKTPQGILTVARIPSWEREELLGGKNRRRPAGQATAAGTAGDSTAAKAVKPLIVVLEDLQDPGNVGTIIRTAEGAGVTGIFLSAKTADCFSPKVIRSTMGSIFRVPIRREADLPGLLDWLKDCGVTSYAAHLRGVHTFTEEDYRGGTAFLIGNEGNGLSEALSQKADVRIRIPMEGRVESLNASVAAALLMYAAHTQRA